MRVKQLISEDQTRFIYARKMSPKHMHNTLYKQLLVYALSSDIETQWL